MVIATRKTTSLFIFHKEIVLKSLPFCRVLPSRYGATIGWINISVLAIDMTVLQFTKDSNWNYRKIPASELVNICKLYLILHSGRSKINIYTQNLILSATARLGRFPRSTIGRKNEQSWTRKLRIRDVLAFLRVTFRRSRQSLGTQCDIVNVQNRLSR